MRYFFLCVFLLLTAVVFCQGRYVVNLTKNSEVSILGTTNVVTFKLHQNASGFIEKNKRINLTQSNNVLKVSESSIQIPVKGFESDNPMALRDFKKLVISNEFPVFTLAVQRVNLPSAAIQTNKFNCNATVELTITGQSKSYNVPFQVTLSSGKILLKGVKKINIRDFNLEPPTAMMGLLKVDEWIEIQVLFECLYTAA